MRKYNIANYVRYKKDVEAQIKRVRKPIDGDYTFLTNKEIEINFLPLVATLAHKQSTSDQASGVLSILDLLQEGALGLCAAVSKLDRELLIKSDDQEKTLKSFLSKRIKGAIRRGINNNRGSMRIPEHKLNEIRKDFGEDRRAVELFFNSVFTSLDDGTPEQQAAAYNIAEVKTYNEDLLSAYLKGLMMQYLNPKEYQVLRLSYGLDCDKHSAKEIAQILGIKGSSSYVRISQLKKLAIDKLIEKVPYSQVVDYLQVRD